MAEVVEAVISDKKKVKKQKVQLCETEAFFDTGIVGSDRET